jgi:hypothetical protein
MRPCSTLHGVYPTKSRNKSKEIRADRTDVRVAMYRGVSTLEDQLVKLALMKGGG